MSTVPRAVTPWFVTFAASMACHAAAFASLGGAAREPAGPTALQTEFQMLAEERSVPPPGPTPPAPKAADPAAPTTRSAAPKPVAARPQAAAQPARTAGEPTPPPLGGTTLTADGGESGSWASVAGDGSVAMGPIGPVATVTPAPSVPARPSSSAASAPPAPPLVAVADLSRKPEAPALSDALKRHYPGEAREAGIGGNAVVRAVITPSGAVGPMELVSESRPGFGAACVATLRGSRWSAPLDRSGRPVATKVRYRCSFEVGR